MSIRKVLGAPVLRLTVLMTKEYLILMLVAFLVAGPVAYVFMNNWLADFAYAISLEWWMFAVSSVLVPLVLQFSKPPELIRLMFYAMNKGL
jgi:hypothetical protein